MRQVVRSGGKLRQSMWQRVLARCVLCGVLC